VCAFRDNPETDIYGGNLYNQYLRKRSLQRELQRTSSKQQALTIKKKLRLAQSDLEYISDDEDNVKPDEARGGNQGDATIVPTLDMGADEEKAEKVVVDVAKKVDVVNEVETNGDMYTEGCESILVCTGVFSTEQDLYSLQTSRASNHNHRDFVINPQLKKPHHVASNVLEAVKIVFKQEGADASFFNVQN
jgi:hypothetical protein